MGACSRISKMHVAGASTHFFARGRGTIGAEHPLLSRYMPPVIVIAAIYAPNTRECRVCSHLSYQFKQSAVRGHRCRSSLSRENTYFVFCDFVTAPVRPWVAAAPPALEQFLSNLRTTWQGEARPTARAKEKANPGAAASGSIRDRIRATAWMVRFRPGADRADVHQPTAVSLPGRPPGWAIADVVTPSNSMASRHGTGDDIPDHTRAGDRRSPARISRVIANLSIGCGRHRVVAAVGSSP